MKDRRVKAKILQWVIPFIILLLVVGVLLLQFFVTSQKEELSEVNENLMNITESYAYDFNVKLKNFSVASSTVGSLAEKSDFKSLETAWNVTNALVENTEAYMAIVCDKSGKGYNQAGETVNLRGKEYFEPASAPNVQYVYCSDDGFEGRSAFMTVTPLNIGGEVEGYLFAYYDVTNFKKLISYMEFDLSTNYYLVDKNGDVLCHTSTNGIEVAGPNIWNDLAGDIRNSSEVNKFIEKFGHVQSDVLEIDYKGDTEDKVYVFAPGCDVVSSFGKLEICHYTE